MRAVVALVMTLVACVTCVSCGTKAEAKSIAASEIVKKLGRGESVVVNGAHITGDLNLAEAGKGLNVMPLAHATIEGEVAFVNCVFEGRVTMSEVREEGRQIVAVDFLRDVSFVACSFMGDVDFSQARCRGRLTAERCTFRETVNMDGARYDGGAVLNKTGMWGRWSACAAVFGHGSSMMGMACKQEVMMQRAKFEGGIVMADSELGHYVELSGVWSSGDMSLANCQVAGRMEMRDAWIGGRLSMPNARFGGKVTMEGVAVLGKIETRGAQFKDGTDVSDCTFKLN